MRASRGRLWGGSFVTKDVPRRSKASLQPCRALQSSEGERHCSGPGAGSAATARRVLQTYRCAGLQACLPVEA